MTTTHIQAELNLISAVGGVVAGVFWIMSARVKVSASQTEDKGSDGTFPARILVNGDDFIATAVEQSRWNQRAAFAAALAAVAQAAAMILSA